MKRRLTKLVVFVLLGAIVNVAVAWGCALWLDIRKGMSTVYRGPDLHDRRSIETLWVVRSSRPGALGLSAGRGTSHSSPPNLLKQRSELLVPNWARAQLFTWWSDGPTQQNESYYGELDARGWPMLSFWSVPGFMLPDPKLPSTPPEGGFRLPMQWTTEHDRQYLRPSTLPYRPIWLGIALNTIFYVAIRWLRTIGQDTARRVNRRKRGQCIKCCYDLRGHPGGGGACPECGTTAL